ncbi:ankyrin repeat-containing domain protein [Penicillium lividum]|nr:ankyrin repeat-containing domain protein [Penicillium lividum]
MSLLRLPTELLLLIAKSLPDRRLSRLLQVNHHLYDLLLPHLYRRRPGFRVDKRSWPSNFMRAIATGNERGTQNFLKFGADVNTVCGSCFLRATKVPISPWFDMQTPLNIAANIGNDALVIMLLDHGAAVNGVVQEDLSPRSKQTQPAVVDALLSGHESTVRILLERGSDLQGPHIWAGGLVSCAVQTGHLGILKLLAEFGADMNVPHGGVYPLSKAVFSRALSTDIVRFLLDHGAEIASIDDGQGRFMRDVISCGTIDTARLLLERGAVYTPDRRSFVVSFATVDTIRLLIEYGMKPDVESLRRAIRTQRLNVVQFLLEADVDLNARDSRGSTVLHFSVMGCRSGGFSMGICERPGGLCGCPMPRQLLRRIEVLSPQKLSDSCRILDTKKDGPVDILRYLIQMGADVNAVDWLGHTPLYMAREYAPAVEQILLDHGALSERPSLKEVQSDTPSLC